MKQFNNFRRFATALAVWAAAIGLTLGSCTKVDDTLGSNLIPDDQQMKAGFKTLSGKLTDGSLNPKQYFETRLYQTDSIVASNISYGYLGSMLNDTFGMRTAGFLSQYTSYYKVDSGYFGYKPIFDSAQLLLSISSGYGGDTTTTQGFCIYEITSNKYLTEKPITEGKTERDSLFFLNFNPVTLGALEADYKSKPLFRFKLGGANGPSKKAVTLEPTTEGKEYIKRLMLQSGKYAKDYSIYSLDSLEQFVQEFKGLYIAPEAEQVSSGGAIYATKLDASGLSVYGRNRNPDDPTLIKDTIGMVYYFYDSYAKHGNVSVNTIVHDWDAATSPAKFEIADARETKPDRPLNKRVYVAGMGGVVTELTFGREFFDELDAIIDYENESSGEQFTTMAVSQARMSVYYTNSDYNWQNLTDINRLIDEMTASVSRMGMYTDYKTLKGIEDYPYAYEKNYNTTISYGGYINRSQGTYVMDVSAYLQALWNSYLKQKEATAPGEQVDLEKVKNRTVYLAPEAYSLYTPTYTVLQGMNIDANNAPIKIDLTYNMIK